MGQVTDGLTIYVDSNRDSPFQIYRKAADGSTEAERITNGLGRCSLRTEAGSPICRTSRAVGRSTFADFPGRVEMAGLERR